MMWICMYLQRECSVYHCTCTYHSISITNGTLSHSWLVPLATNSLFVSSLSGQRCSVWNPLLLNFHTYKHFISPTSGARRTYPDPCLHPWPTNWAKPLFFARAECLALCECAVGNNKPAQCHTPDSWLSHKPISSLTSSFFRGKEEEGKMFWCSQWLVFFYDITFFCLGRGGLWMLWPIYCECKGWWVQFVLPGRGAEVIEGIVGTISTWSTCFLSSCPLKR